MRRILLFSTNYLPALGGAEIAIKEITGRMPDSRFDLMTPRFSRNRAKIEKLGNISVYRMGFGFTFDKYLLPFLGVWQALRLSRRDNYDLVWAMMASHGAIAAAFFKRLRQGVPLVLTLQEGDEEAHLSRYVFGVEFLYRFFIRPFYLLPFRCADYVTVISTSLALRARKENAGVPIEVVPNGVDVARFSKEVGRGAVSKLRGEFGFTMDDIVVISVSRLVEKNGIGDLIKAAVLLPDNYKVLVVGEGYLRKKLEREIFNLGLSGKVVLAGARSSEEIPLFMKASDIFARPSLSEGFGNVFVEAFAAGIPVVATPVGGIVDFLEDKKTGLFCGVSDPTDLALKISMAVNDVDLRKSLIAGASAIVAEKYDWNKIAGSMGTVFDKVRAEKRYSIVIATGIYPPQIGGSAEYAFNLNANLEKSGHRVRLVKYGAERFLPGGLRHGVYFLKCLQSLWRFDHIIALDNFSAALPAVSAARLVGKKSYVRVGGDFLWEQYVERTGDMLSLPGFNRKMPVLSRKEALIYRFIKWVFDKADVIIFSTEWLAGIFRDSYKISRDKIKVVENYYGRKEEGVTPIKKNFLWAGRDIKLKNLENIKNAFSEAKKIDASLGLEVVRLPHDALLEKMKTSYATISVSLSEVSPNFVIESVYSGKPFLTTKHCGIMDRLGPTGLYAEPTDVNDIKDKILMLADDKVYADLLGNNRKFNFTHSWEEISGEFLSIIKG